MSLAEKRLASLQSKGMPGSDSIAGIQNLDLESEESENLQFFLKPGEAIQLITNLPKHLVGPTLDVLMLAEECKDPWLTRMVHLFLELQVSVDGASRKSWEAIQTAQLQAMVSEKLSEERDTDSGSAKERTPIK